jgi:hypothetical protein
MELSELIQRLEYLEAENVGLRAELAAAHKRIAELEEELAKRKRGSTNSSKPPSSDFFNGAREEAKKERKKRSSRRKKKKKKEPKPARLAPAELVTRRELVPIEECPRTGAPLCEHDVKLDTFQHAELRELPLDITEYSLESRWCDECNCYHQAPRPHQGRKFGPRLVSFFSYLKAQRVSVQGVVQLVEEVFRVPTSKSTVQKAIDNASKAFETPYEEAVAAVRDFKLVHIDETGWKIAGKLVWAWVFCSHLLSVIVIRPSRATEVLYEILGEDFDGALVSDFYSAYVKYACPRQQYCLAHLIRTIRGLASSTIEKNKVFAQAVLYKFKQLLIAWHTYDPENSASYHRKVRNLKTRLERILVEFDPPNKESRRIKNRILKHWDSIFRFLENPGEYPPTNNHSERMLRFLVCIRNTSLFCSLNDWTIVVILSTHLFPFSVLGESR